MAADLDLMTMALQRFLAKNNLSHPSAAKIVIVARDVPHQHAMMRAIAAEFSANSMFTMKGVGADLDTATINGVEVSVKVPRPGVVVG